MDVVDVAFALRGGSIPADHGWRLFELLAERLDWLAGESAAAVHPIRGARAVAGTIHLGSRARMMLRLPQERAAQALALSGMRLDLGEGFEVGDAHLRTLFAHHTLYSQFVDAGTPDEIEFQRKLAAELREAQIDCKLVCGRARRAQAGAAQIAGFSVMLHQLTPEQSLRMQGQGLGAGHKLGCGIFIPHKSAAAVGD